LLKISKVSFVIQLSLLLELISHIGFNQIAVNLKLTLIQKLDLNKSYAQQAVIFMFQQQFLKAILKKK